MSAPVPHLGGGAEVTWHAGGGGGCGVDGVFFQIFSNGKLAGEGITYPMVPG